MNDAESSSSQKGASRGTLRANLQTRQTQVCVADPYPVPSTLLHVTELAPAGALGSPALTLRRLLLPSAGYPTHPVFEPAGENRVKPVRTAVLSRIAGIHPFIPGLQLYDLTIEPQPQLEIRVRAIYAVDDGATPAWTLEHVRDVVNSLVEAANRDLQGTGLRLVTFARHDVEIRDDTKLRRDIALADDIVAALTLGEYDEPKGKAIIDAAATDVRDHRNAVAVERPNALLWIFSRGNRFDEVRDADGNFLRWDYVDDRGGSFSGGDNGFVALHEAFLNSVEGARADASRAVHETGHYLGPWHTHREPFHDLAKVVSPEVLDDPAPARLAAWKKKVAAWLDSELPDNASAIQAQEKYDVDRDSGVFDTPPDPGAGIMALANEAAGHGPDELGPITTVSLDVPGVSGSVALTPLRDNVMGYYLRETAEPMRFTEDQAKLMRTSLIDGTRRPLVAAQLGDTATPDLRVCAVWSPSVEAQRLVWGWSPDDHAAEDNRMRQAGMVMVHQQAYTLNDRVLFDGIWNPGSRSQEILWSWLDEHVRADIPVRAARGMLPMTVQGYQHLDHGVRYNVIYEPGNGDARVLLGVTQDELTNEWKHWMPKGYRMTCLSSHVDASGAIRYSAVLRPVATPQSWVAGWTLEDIAEEYGRRWSEGWRIRHVTVARIADGQRWSAVFEPDEQDQLVYWAHVRERITEVYDQMWASDFKLRAMCAVPA